MSRELGAIKNPVIVSRRDELAVASAIVIDNARHPSGEVIPRGALMAKQASNSKWVRYAEAAVTGSFSASAVGFTLDPTSVNFPNFRVGDVIEAVDGTALGTIATLNPTTGVGTLTGNSANALTAGSQNVRVALSQAALASRKGRFLMDEITMGSQDGIRAAYFRGYFLKSHTSLTAAAQSAMGASDTDTDEVEL